jgi:hemerythrin
MSTGMPIVDAEHQEWIRRFNDFEAAIQSGQGIEFVQQMLDFMAEYSEKHFVHEEILAGDVDTPEVKLNRQEHNIFRENISDIKDWIKQGGVTSVEVVSLKMDLEKWLVHHICFVDVQVWAKVNKGAELSA